MTERSGHGHMDDVKVFEDQTHNGEWRVEYFDDEGGFRLRGPPRFCGSVCLFSTRDQSK